MTETTLARRLARRRHRTPSPRALFLRGFLNHPVMVGSIVPSSNRLIRRMLAPVDWDEAQVFVEYGPGVGTFSRPILAHLRPDARLIAIDTNPEFFGHLRAGIRDPRFTVVHGSAADVARILIDQGVRHVDYVLSGLPFSTLPPGLGDRIAGETADALRPGGAFLVYQFSPRVHAFLSPHFGRIDHGFEWWNIPPAQLYWAYKPIPAAG